MLFKEKRMAAGLLHSPISVLFTKSLIMGSVTQFIWGSFLFSVSKFFYPLFSFICSFLFRLHGNGNPLRENFEHYVVIPEENNISTTDESEMIESEPQVEAEMAGPEKSNVGFSYSEDDSEKKKPEFSFSFRFPTFEEFCKTSCATANTSEKEIDNEIHNYDPGVLFTSKYEIIPPNSSFDSLVSSQFNSEEEAMEMDWDCYSGSINLDSHRDGFLSDGDFGEKVEITGVEMSEFDKIGGSDDFDGEEEERDMMDELLTLEKPVHENNDADVSISPPDGATTSEFLAQEDFHDHQNSKEEATTECEIGGDKDNSACNNLRNGSYDSENLRSKDAADIEDSSKLETLWEHQDLIEQLKMELRKVRATGLPTILEESESPKIMEDLKPWKIDERFHHEDCIDELHKFYKSYRERMRKFDIFNYQKMYAIGFLQLKDPLESISSSKPSGPTLKSILSQNFWPLKPKSSDSDPMIKFMKELQSDLEVVYVGQICLSWEFLHWQYGKALDLWDSDPRGMHRYNEVAGEFQQFQVLLQRFIENEHFQGPRVQYYIKQRCLFRNLLQIPVIKEDNSKDRRKGRKGDTVEFVISSETLVEIMEESIRIFWRFVRADKDCSSLIVKGHKGTPAQLQNPGDLELLMEVKKDLHKKERKLRDMVKSGNCILRKFRKYREDDADQVLYFFSQVDMKLVSRVLNMTRITTDQLVWCHSKLSKISFESRKIQVEPSFVLFPCQ